MGRERSRHLHGTGGPGSPTCPLGGAIDPEARQREIAWVLRARSEERAFRSLYDTAFRLAWAWALRATGDPRVAQTLTECTLQRVFAVLESFDGSRSFGAFVLTFAAAVLRETKGDACPPVAAEAPESEQGS